LEIVAWFLQQQHQRPTLNAFSNGVSGILAINKEVQN